MRRAAIALVLCAAGAAALLGAGGSESTYRVDAIFDNTASLIPGQDVKIAGAKVGSVSDVKLTRDRRARVQMEIEKGFAPFRADADCIIRPQSLIGEKFVQCFPGSPRARALEGRGGQAPTVPLANTHSPVDLDLVFAALRRPYRERLTIIVNELGTGLAGRPADLAAAIERANPALQETNEVLEVLDSERARLGRIVERSDAVLAELARRRGEVASFVDRAGSVTQALAGRRGELDETIRRLPPLLDELEPSAERLAAFSRDATPVARDLRAAAPAVTALVGDLDPLADAARPALRRLAEMSVVGRRAVASTRPVARRLQPIARRLGPLLTTARELVESLQETGAVEGLQSFFYNGSLATSRFDRFSHILPSYQVTGSCQEYATEPAPGCSARFRGGSGAAAGSSRSPARAKSRRSTGAAPGRQRNESPAPVAPGRANPEAPVPGAPGPDTSLLDFLLAP